MAINVTSGLWSTQGLGHYRREPAPYCPGTQLPARVVPSYLPTRYAMSETDSTSGMAVPAVYAISGADLGHCATRLGECGPSFQPWVHFSPTQVLSTPRP
eukprot:2111147-Rhodomonas_salina.3